MKLADIVRLLDRCDNELITTGSRSLLDFSIGFLSSAESAGRDVSYDDLSSAYDAYLERQAL